MRYDDDDGEPQGEHRAKRGNGRSYWDPSVETGAEKTGAYVYSQPPLSAEDEYLAELERRSEDPEDPPELTDLLPMLDGLTAKQRFVLECRAGLRRNDYDKALTLEEIADLMGISRQAVLRIEERAVKTLRRTLDLRSEDP